MAFWDGTSDPFQDPPNYSGGYPDPYAGYDSSTGYGNEYQMPYSVFRDVANAYSAPHRHPHPSGGGGNGGGGNGSGGGQSSHGMSYEDYLRLQQQAQRSAAQQSAQAAAAAARQQHQSVFDWVRSQFQSWGMGDLGSSVVDILKDSRSPEQAIVEIRKTDAYKQRFAGNIARAKAGFGMLTEAEYIGMESSYRQAMHAAGLPKGFYDNPDDFAGFIAKDVSPAEIQRRADLAGNLAQNKDPQLWKELQSRGISKGDAAAYMLDPDKALPAIERKLASAEIGSEARSAGMGFAKGTGFENKLVDKGITREQARQAFNTVSDEQPSLNQAAKFYGEDGFTDKQLVKAELGIGGRDAKKRAKSLASRERATWKGGSGGSSAYSPSNPNV